MERDDTRDGSELSAASWSSAGSLTDDSTAGTGTAIGMGTIASASGSVAASASLSVAHADAAQHARRGLPLAEAEVGMGSSKGGGGSGSLMMRSRSGAMALTEAVSRAAAVHLNGVPCVLLQVRPAPCSLANNYCTLVNLQVYSASWQSVPSPSTAWADVSRTLAAVSRSRRRDAEATTQGTPPGSADKDKEVARKNLFDDLLVLAMHWVAVEVYPTFLRSGCFQLYAAMQQLAFSRPPLSRDSFKWIKVSEGINYFAILTLTPRVQPLGRGGYGMVHAVQKADSGKLYAVKCMGVWAALL